jgi:hypothetical protein
LVHQHPKKVYCFITRPPKNGLVDTVAIAECGHILANHTSSDIHWAKHDLGVTSTRNHDIYSKHCPDGFQVIWVDNPHDHPGFHEALKRNEIIMAKETSPLLH